MQSNWIVNNLLTVWVGIPEEFLCLNNVTNIITTNGKLLYIIRKLDLNAFFFFYHMETVLSG